MIEFEISPSQRKPINYYKILEMANHILFDYVINRVNSSNFDKLTKWYLISRLKGDTAFNGTDLEHTSGELLIPPKLITSSGLLIKSQNKRLGLYDLANYQTRIENRNQNQIDLIHSMLKEFTSSGSFETNFSPTYEFVPLLALLKLGINQGGLKIILDPDARASDQLLKLIM